MTDLSKAIDVVFDTPYSSATEFYRWLEPSRLDPAMGEVCVRQTMEAAARARAAGAKVFEVFDGRHVGALSVTDEGATYVLDPYLMPCETLLLPRGGTAMTGGAVEVPGPRLWGSGVDLSSTVVAATLTSVADREWILETSLRYAGNGADIRRFRMSSTSRFVLAEFESRMARLLLDPEQTTVSIRVVHADRSGVTQASLPLHRDGSRESYRAEAVQLKSSAESDSGAAWGRLAASVGRTQREICDYLVGAANLHADLLSGRRQL